MMRTQSHFRIASLLLSSVALMLLVDTATAQEPPASPRTPMAPGSAWLGDKMGAINVVPREAFPYGGMPAAINPGLVPLRDGSPYVMVPTMAPPQLGGLGTMIRSTAAPDLAAQEANAIDVLRGKKADVVVLSRANAHLVLQLYRPDQNQWQEYRLGPLTMTSINCQPCNGRLRFAFSDGTAQREMDVEVPSLLRVFPDARTNKWRWDSFKLLLAGTPEEPPSSSPPQ